MIILFNLFIHLIFDGGECSDNPISPLKNFVQALEQDKVTLSCKYTESSNVFFWYRQYPRSPPELLTNNYDKIPGFPFRHQKEKNIIHLEISSAKLTDTALYYCASLSGSGNRLIFGHGVNLQVQSKETKDPSFYRLGHNETEACLATDFSHHNALNNTELFQGTNPARADGDKFYSQVALIGDNEASSCSEGPEKETDHCDADYFEPDWKVNFLSMTMLALRILFLKTVVFNVLMTLKVWMS